jgi:sensor histidine kinase regulating citrate/malate metabolism
MQLLLYNLISNAVEAIQDQKDSTGIISVLFEYKKEFVHIEIANTGKQIPQSVLKKIQSKKSVSTKGRHHGKGLQIIHDISEKYDANLTVNSSQGQTIFSLDVPYTD